MQTNRRTTLTDAMLCAGYTHRADERTEKDNKRAVFDRFGAFVGRMNAFEGWVFLRTTPTV